MCNDSSDETIEFADFTWKDGDVSLPTGDLLSTLITLTNSERVSNVVENPDVLSYLENAGYVRRTENGECAVNDERKADLVALGNKVSDAIDQKLEMCMNKNANIVPKIYAMYEQK